MAMRIGCYSTARVSAGRVERTERHAERLRRDAKRLGLSPPTRSAVENALLEMAGAVFPDTSGIVRIEWSAEPNATPELITTHRPLGDDADRWRAGVAKTVHPGPEARENTKHVDVPAYLEAREESAALGVEEVLLFDQAGYLVEGAASNCLIVDEASRILTPARGLGAVEGLGLTILREYWPEIREAEIELDEVRCAREFLCVNAVRGPVPVIQLDGKPIASGQPGPIAQKFRRSFGRD